MITVKSYIGKNISNEIMLLHENIKLLLELKNLNTVLNTVNKLFENIDTYYVIQGDIDSIEVILFNFFPKIH